jgi:hypothetical protein
VTPSISIIIPETFEDPRSDVTFFRAWVEQCCDAPFEIIVVAKPGRPGFEHAVRQVLRSCDQFIVSDLVHRIEGYTVGADAARGQWLFITENHVKPDARCLQEVVAYCGNNAIAAGVVNSVSMHRSKIGRAEGAAFQRQVQESHRLHPERMPLAIRGFAIRRDIFFRSGGLIARYQTYAPMVLGFRMAQAGLKIRLIDQAYVQHSDCVTFGGFATEISDTTHGECLFAADRRPQLETPAAIPWMRGDWHNVKALLLVAAFPGRRLTLRRRIHTALGLFREAISHILKGRFATHLLLLSARAVCQWSRLSFAMTRSGTDDEMAGFVRMWRRIVVAARLEYAARLTSQKPAEQISAALGMAEFTTDQMAGFYAPETFAGRQLRWSCPLAEITIRIPAVAHRFVIETCNLRSDVRTLAMGVFVNGNRIHDDDIATDEGNIVFDAPGDWIQVGKPTRITIITEPLREPRPWSGAWGRRLGLPFFDFHAYAIER